MARGSHPNLPQGLFISNFRKITFSKNSQKIDIFDQYLMWKNVPRCSRLKIFHAVAARAIWSSKPSFLQNWYFHILANIFGIFGQNGFIWPEKKWALRQTWIYIWLEPSEVVETWADKIDMNSAGFEPNTFLHEFGPKYCLYLLNLHDLSFKMRRHLSESVQRWRSCD